MSDPDAHQNQGEDLGDSTESYEGLYTYAEMLESLRRQYAKWQLGEIAGIEGARLRLLVACMALNVPEEQIRTVIPGVDEICRRHPRCRAAYYPDRGATPEPEPYCLGDDKDRWIEKNMERYRAYLEGVLEKADAWKADALSRGKIRERLTFVAYRPLHRKGRARKGNVGDVLDIAEICLVAVRVKILGHRYVDIAIDRGRETEDQIFADVSRLKSAVHQLWRKAFPRVKKSAR